MCKVTKASKVSIKEENATHFKVKITKGKKSYTGWIKKSSISFTKTYKNKKSVKTMYLAVNRNKADALMGDAVNAINTSYEQCKKGWEYLNEMRKREGLKPVQWSDDAYNKTLRQYTIVAQNGLHLGNHLGEYDYYAGISGCGIYSKELGEYYHELASGTSDIAFGVGNKSITKQQYVNDLNTGKNVMTNKNVGISAMADMLGGHPGKYDWHPDAHSKTLMDPNATYGCMVIIQKADGQCGAIFEIR